MSHLSNSYAVISDSLLSDSVISSSQITKEIVLSLWSKLSLKSRDYQSLDISSYRDKLKYINQWRIDVNQIFSQHFEQSLKIRDKEQDIYKLFEQQVQSILFKHIQKTNDLENNCKQFARNLNFNDFFLNVKINKLDEQIKDEIKKQIEQIKYYKILSQFGEDKSLLQSKFIIFFVKNFFNKLSPQVFSSILQNILQNPNYSWTDREDLTKNQIIQLINSLWLKKDNQLSCLLRAHNYLKTSSQKKISDIAKIQEQLIIQKQKISKKDLDKYRKLLANYDFDKLFDQRQKIDFKKLYLFAVKNCPNYLYSRDQTQCSIKIQQQYRLILRQKMLQMYKENKFDIKDWNKLEDCFLRNVYYQIEPIFRKKQYYLQAKKWANQHFQLYYKMSLKTPKLKDEVRKELQKLLLQSKNQFSYKEFVSIIQKLLKEPYFRVIQSEESLDKGREDLYQNFQELIKVQQYSSRQLIDIDQLRKNTEKFVFQAIDSSDLNIAHEIKCKIYWTFLERPNFSKIYQNRTLSFESRRKIVEKLKQTNQILDYINKHQRVSILDDISKARQQLSKIIPSYDDISLILNHILINGPFNFIQETDYSIKLDCHQSDLSKLLNKKFKPQNRKSLKQFQESETFKNILKRLPEVSRVHLQQYKSKLKLSIRIIFKKYFTIGKKQKQHIYKLLTEIIDGQDLKKIQDHEQLEGQKIEKIKEQIKKDSEYRTLIKMIDNIRSCKQKYDKINRINKIQSLYQQQCLSQLDDFQKEQIVSILSDKINQHKLQDLDWISKKQIKLIKQYLIQPDQFENFQSCKEDSISSVCKQQQNNSPNHSKQNIQNSIQILQGMKFELQTASQKNESNPSFSSQNESFKIKETVVIPSNTLLFPLIPPPPLPPQKALISRQQIIRKWLDRSKSIQVERLYPKFQKQSLKHQQPFKFIQNILKSYPWSKESLDFLIALQKYPQPLKDFIKDLEGLFTKEQYKEQFEADVERIKQQ